MSKPLSRYDKGCTRGGGDTVTQQDQQSRATLREWILYMVKYPAYFYQATGFRATDANIERFACELFKGDIRLGNIRAGQLWGYKRRFVRWAKARGIGKYAKQSISEAGAKAQAVRYDAAKLKPKRIHANMGLDKGKHAKAEAIVREVRQASNSSASQGQGHKEQ